MKKRVLSLIMAICMLCGLALNGAVLPVSADETLPAIPFEVDFEDGADPLTTGWTQNNTPKNNTFTVVDDPAGNGGKVGKVAKNTVAETNFFLYNFEPTSDAVVLEYSFYVTGATNYIDFLPTLQYEDGTPLVILDVRPNQFGYSREVAGSVTKLDVIPAKDTWHTVILKADINKQEVVLTLDGTEYTLDAPNRVNYGDHGKLSGITTGTYQRIFSIEFYIDDLSVSKWDNPVTFEYTNLQLANNLNLAIFLDKEQKSDWTGCYAKVTLDGTTKTLEQASWGSDTTRYFYQFTVPVYAYQIDKDITITIFDSEGNPISEPFTTSVKEYAEDKKAENPTKLGAMVDALLAYGEQAKILFGGSSAEN